jgi:hypothetical protein
VEAENRNLAAQFVSVCRTWAQRDGKGFWQLLGRNFHEETLAGDVEKEYNVMAAERAG